MVDVAREMERRGLDLPLLIGGATTSRQHTAVRIAPAYSQPVVHVLDASRVVGVVSDLLDPERRVRLDVENRADQERLRDLHAEKERKPLLPLARARENRQRVAFDDLPVPEFTGRRAGRARPRDAARVHRLAVLLPRVGAEGEVPGDPRAAGGARAVRRRAAAARPRSSSERLLTARGVFGFWPAHAEGDDVVVDETDALLLPPPAVGLRRLAPEPLRSRTTSRRPATTSARSRSPPGIGADELAARFAAEHDDYHAIMVKALADRLAEAFAEYLHEVARRAWYETGPQLPPEQLLAERFRGIRPAFGYPACPDHSEKSKLFALLGAEEAGLALTETFAMTPAASVSGIYLAHPEARYFSVGRLGRDQVDDYAARKRVARRRGRSAGCDRISATSRRKMRKT